jgi:sulfite reductase (ferredoxin)
MTYDDGCGIVLPQEKTEPLYCKRYLPRKFKVVFTVPGNNSMDIYTDDIGCVVITNPSTGELEGFNVMVGGGMGQTHNREKTFPRTVDHFGYVPKEDAIETLRAILAAQRDHSDREVHATARIKCIVHTLGTDNFRNLVES